MHVLEPTPVSTATTPERWVDVATVAKHIGFNPRKVAQMAKAGKIPAYAVRNGKRTFLRMRLSEVDAVLESARCA